MSTFSIIAEGFQGPFGLLLELIEGKKLEITSVNLAAIAEQYTLHMSAMQKIVPEEIADFLIVAAKLLYLKSKALLPDLAVEDEDDAESLADQLKQYRKFLEAAAILEARFLQHQEGYAGPCLVKTERSFAPPAGLTAHDLVLALRDVMRRAQSSVSLPERMMQRVVSVEEKIELLKERLRAGTAAYFHDVIAHSSKADVVVSFLALLELVRQQVIRLEQQDAFSPIAIART